MKLNSLVGMGILAALLSGCGPTPEEQRAMDTQACTGYGFKPGTDTFAHCMMETDQQRKAEAAANQRAWQDQQAAMRRQQQADQARCQRQAAITPGMSCN
jgi:hypothetical protein